MLISIIIRTTGRKSLITAVNSVLGQHYQDFEIIIIEDGNDKVPSLLGNLINHPKIKYHSLIPQRGRSYAGNIGMTQAQGEYINFLDDDDELYPNHLQILVSNIKQQSIIASLAHECGITNSGLISAKYLFPRFNHNLANSNYLIINNVLFPKEAFNKLGGFDVDLDYLEDWVLWAKYAQNYQVILIDEITSCYYVPFSLIKYYNRIKIIKSHYLQAYNKIQQFKLNKSPLKENKISQLLRKIKILLLLIASRVVISKKFN